MDDSNDKKLLTLDELDYLLPVLNMAFISRAAGKSRGTFANWKNDGADLLKTKTRREAREVLLQILEEVHRESGYILGKLDDQREEYEYLTNKSDLGNGE